MWFGVVGRGVVPGGHEQDGSELHNEQGITFECTSWSIGRAE
jgi:hypothetical protein